FRTMADWLVDGVKMPRGFALHFDTGMNRLGLPVADAAEIATASEAQAPILIMSHLACSEDRDAPMNGHQARVLDTVATAFPDVSISLANSGGVWLGADYQHALSRPGIALYGGGRPPAKTPLKPGMTLAAPILQVRQLETGDTVGYNATWRAEKPTLVATLAIGYGDGFPRSASNKGFATLSGRRCPIIGRVSMDLITIDVTEAADLARPGVYAQLIGPEAPLEEQAALAGTIGYELTTGLTPRVKRIYEP
ncbi:MAG: alanine racemase C-terminal domain-containing protein, partial [Pseudomonadota bacterium]